ncbi:kinase-like domain-containing protein [Hygrophoropsis aurantiaca]|uniref:Kinase-like domain-containing protein n=1 Tax=Hygrophoropsis aurantiaca TaxID=72124 RepID=A0ACB8A0X8_9AGAM|nr:kinase-like domain-containing protein [Hygrophoropsis aurantiaca]
MGGSPDRQPQKIKVDFDPSRREFDPEDLVAFLESIRPWLEEHGYFLYLNSYELFGEPLESAIYSYPQFEYDGKTQLPYSFFGGDPVVTNGYARHKLPSETPARVMFAQDSQHRHVALKLVKDGSVEYNIYRRLGEEASLYSAHREEFGCVIPPLDFLELEGYWFVVMPRWGHTLMMPWFDSVREVLQFMHCCLKGLSLLHRHFIAHRDIKPGNMLVSHFADKTYYDRHNELRPYLRRPGMLTYALCDFNISVMFPPTSTPSERRLPASESFIIGCNFVYDTAQGELDYDPFAFDVCALGMLFCEYFQHLTATAPMLAPFLDCMIMRDIAQRFTAAEALRFFE